MKERRKAPRKNHSVNANQTGKKLEQAKKPITSGILIPVPPGKDITSLRGITDYYLLSKLKLKNETIV